MSTVPMITAQAPIAPRAWVAGPVTARSPLEPELPLLVAATATGTLRDRSGLSGARPAATRVWLPTSRPAGMVTTTLKAPAPSVVVVPSVTGVEYTARVIVVFGL